MTRRDQRGSWLVGVLADAKKRNLCTRPYCTTCGTDEFWLAVLAGAMLASSLIPRDGQLSGQIALDDDDQRLIDVEIVRGLCNLVEEDVVANNDAVRTILIGCAIRNVALNELLQGTPAGAELQRMREHSREINEERLRRAEFERTAPQRLEEKRALRAQRLTERAKRKTVAAERRDVVLAQLAELPEQERIRWMASDDFELPFGAIPANLVPKRGFNSLSPSEQQRMRIRAGRLKYWNPFMRSPI